MATYCPIMQENVLYLDCKDCEDTDTCRKLKLCGQNRDANTQNIDTESKGDTYEKDL